MIEAEHQGGSITFMLCMLLLLDGHFAYSTFTPNKSLSFEAAFDVWGIAEHFLENLSICLGDDLRELFEERY